MQAVRATPSLHSTLRLPPRLCAPRADYHTALCDVENVADKLGEDGVVALLLEARDRSHRKRALTATFIHAMTTALASHSYTATPLRDGTGVECVLGTKAGPVRTRHRLTHLAALSGREAVAPAAPAATTGPVADGSTSATAATTPATAAGSTAVVSGGGTSGGVTLAWGTISVVMSDIVPSERWVAAPAASAGTCVQPHGVTVAHRFCHPRLAGGVTWPPLWPSPTMGYAPHIGISL